MMRRSFQDVAGLAQTMGLNQEMGGLPKYMNGTAEYREYRPLGFTKKQLSLFVLVIQNSTLVLMMRYSLIVKKEGQQSYIPSTAVFLAEVVKIIACLAVIYWEKQSWKRFWYVVRKEILGQPTETMKMLIPSGLYALQNNLLYVALSNLEAAAFQVTYQMKILSTAVFSVVLLGKSLSRQKWFALVLLMIGVTLVQSQVVGGTAKSSSIPAADLSKESHFAAALPLSTEEQDPSRPPAADPVAVSSETARLLAKQNPFLGLLAVITSCISSGFAGCYFEKVLKSSETSMWVRNIQLGITGAAFSLLAMITYDGAAIMEGGLLQGYDWLTWVVVGNQALGGLLVAIVVKYADNILKGFATSLSIIISGIISWYLFDFKPSAAFICGAIIVMVSSYLYGRPESKIMPIELLSETKTKL